MSTRRPLGVRSTDTTWWPSRLNRIKQVARAYPSEELHLVMNNYAVHKTPR